MTQQPGNFDEELRLGFEGLVENTIKEIKDLPVDGLRSDCGFQNIWEEFAYQVQIKESSSFRTYEQTIEWVCQGVVEELPDELVKSFWLSSDARDRWHYENDDCEMDEEPGEPGLNAQREGLAEDLIQKVLDAAADYDLPSYYADDSPEGDGSRMVLVYGRQTLEYDDCVEKVVQAMRNLPKSSRQSGEDSPLEDVWEEFAAQVQGEEGFEMGLYEELAENACRKVVDALTESNLQMLWQQSDAGIGWIDEDPLPYEEDMRADVFEELYRKVLGAAADYDLPEFNEEDEGLVWEDDDLFAVETAKAAARMFLGHPDIKPGQIVGLGRALYALERLPQATPGVYCEYDVSMTTGNDDFSEMHYISFRITDDDFEISTGGSVYDKRVGSDSVSGPRWLLEFSGYADRNLGDEIESIEGRVRRYLRSGAEITVDDDSATMVIEEEDEDSEAEAERVSEKEVVETNDEKADEVNDDSTDIVVEDHAEIKFCMDAVTKAAGPKLQPHLQAELDRIADKVIAKQRAARSYQEGVDLAAKELFGEGMENSTSLKYNSKFMEAALQLGWIYVQQGAANYNQWSAKIVAGTGEKIKPYLLSTWIMINKYPDGEKYDQETVRDLFQYAGIQYEKGYTNFQSMEKQIVGKLGEEYKPYVKMLYEAILAFKRQK